MFSFFKRLAEAEADAKRLKAEAEFYLETLLSVKSDLAIIVKRYEAETKANRRREDELTAIIISQSAPNARPPMPREFQPELVEKTEDDKEFDEQVTQAVHAFVNDLTIRGNPPSQAERELIEIRIRANPHQYI